MTEMLLSLSGISRRFPGVVANDDVSMNVAEGEIHALIGENGAGKSTLVKIVYGLVKPDSGSMKIDGEHYAPLGPTEARAAGIGMVFQHFSLFDALTVTDNIALGMDNPPPMRKLSVRTRELSKNYGLPLDSGKIAGALSAGERQRVEIVKCLLQNPRILIMDEPTSVLTPQETKTLFKTLRKLAESGVAILYISHKLKEIRALCDRATILRGGRNVGSCVPSEASIGDMAEMMVGSSLKSPVKKSRNRGKVVLEVDNLCSDADSAFGIALKQVSFKVGAGEILGIGGVAGNGQEELLAALSGETKVESNTIRLKNEPIGHLDPDARRILGLLAAPADRMGHAAAPNMTLVDNAVLTGNRRERLSSRGFINWDASSQFCQRIINAFDVRTPGTWNTAGSLSGGNLQKFVIGREILQKPDILAVNQPTWGVDAAAAAAIRQALIDLARNGSAVICISQDLDELIEISDRFGTLNRGELSDIRKTESLSTSEIGLMMGGAHGVDVAHAPA
ncbi:MAG: ABC transporter ATP-binding protein [Roseovarius sp.]|nr:ABC transporter ATP-binding protein [Roseovarius sp.]